jgi:hypothetical protein
MNTTHNHNHNASASDSKSKPGKSKPKPKSKRKVAIPLLPVCSRELALDLEPPLRPRKKPRVGRPAPPLPLAGADKDKDEDEDEDEDEDSKTGALLREREFARVVGKQPLFEGYKLKDTGGDLNVKTNLCNSKDGAVYFRNIDIDRDLVFKVHENKYNPYRKGQLDLTLVSVRTARQPVIATPLFYATLANMHPDGESGNEVIRQSRERDQKDPDDKTNYNFSLRMSPQAWQEATALPATRCDSEVLAFYVWLDRLYDKCFRFILEHDELYRTAKEKHCLAHSSYKGDDDKDYATVMAHIRSDPQELAKHVSILRNSFGRDLFKKIKTPRNDFQQRQKFLSFVAPMYYSNSSGRTPSPYVARVLLLSEEVRNYHRRDFAYNYVPVIKLQNMKHLSPLGQTAVNGDIVAMTFRLSWTHAASHVGFKLNMKCVYHTGFNMKPQQGPEDLYHLVAQPDLPSPVGDEFPSSGSAPETPLLNYVDAPAPGNGQEAPSGIVGEQSAPDLD